MNELTVSKNELVSVIEKNSLSETLKPLISEIHLFDTFIAGTTYLKDKSVLQQITIDDQLTLIREDNKFDDHAIVIYTKDNKKLGYIPEKDIIIFSRLMDAGKCLIAKISKIEIKGTFHKISIGIYLVDF